MFLRRYPLCLRFLWLWFERSPFWKTIREPLEGFVCAFSLCARPAFQTAVADPAAGPVYRPAAFWLAFSISLVSVSYDSPLKLRFLMICTSSRWIRQPKNEFPHVLDMHRSTAVSKIKRKKRRLEKGAGTAGGCLTINPSAAGPATPPPQPPPNAERF